MSEVATTTAAPEAEAGRRETRFLRRGGPLFALLALPFLASVAGALGLALIYHWPYVVAPTYYFIVRPPFVWFAMLAPALVFGPVALRWRWFAAGCAVWLLAFVTTQEVLPCARPFAGRAREKFEVARMAMQGELSKGQPAGGDVEMPLRLVTWNVHEGRRNPYRNVDQLEALHPDIVLMQEFGPGRGTNMEQAVRDSAAFRRFHSDGIRRTILSRWPVEELQYNPLKDGLATVWRVHVARGLSLVCIDVHLTAPTLKTQLLRGWSWAELREAAARSREELEALGGLLKHYSLQGTVILAGDFNLPPYYPDLRRARGSFLDCFATAGYGWGKTAPEKLPAMRPDQIYVPPGSHVCYAAAVPTRYSDHYMTLAEVTVPMTVLAPPEGAPEETHER